MFIHAFWYRPGRSRNHGQCFTTMTGQLLAQPLAVALVTVQASAGRGKTRYP